MIEIGDVVKYLVFGQYTVMGYLYYQNKLWYVGIDKNGNEKDLSSLHCMKVRNEN